MTGHYIKLVDDAEDGQKRRPLLEAPAKPWLSRGARGLLAMVGSAFFFSLMAVVVKCLQRLKTFEVVFWLSIFMLIQCMCILRWKGVRCLGPPNSQIILTTRGVVGFGFMGGYYYSIKTLPLSDAVVITYTAPMITAVFAAVLLREAWGVLDALGSVLCIAGVMLISKPTFVMQFFVQDVAPLPFWGTAGAIFAAFSATGTFLVLRYARHVDPFVSTNYVAIIGIALAPVTAWAYGEVWHLPAAEDFLKLALLASLSVTGQACMGIGLALQTAAKAAAMNYIQVVFAFIFQISLLHQGSDLLSVIGSIMIASWGGVALAKEVAINAETPKDLRSPHQIRFPVVPVDDEEAGADTPPDKAVIGIDDEVEGAIGA